MHFSQFYFGSDAAQPPEIDTNFVEKTVISTKYALGKRCHFLVSKTKIVKLLEISCKKTRSIFIYVKTHFL